MRGRPQSWIDIIIVIAILAAGIALGWYKAHSHYAKQRVGDTVLAIAGDIRLGLIHYETLEKGAILDAKSEIASGLKVNKMLLEPLLAAEPDIPNGDIARKVLKDLEVFLAAHTNIAASKAVR